jgi:hypothetical protein
MSEMQEMIPWERDIYLDMLRRHIEDENLKLKTAKNDTMTSNALRRNR